MITISRGRGPNICPTSDPGVVNPPRISFEFWIKETDLKHLLWCSLLRPDGNLYPMATLALTWNWRSSIKKSPALLSLWISLFIDNFYFCGLGKPVKIKEAEKSTTMAVQFPSISSDEMSSHGIFPPHFQINIQNLRELNLCFHIVSHCFTPFSEAFWKPQK